MPPLSRPPQLEAPADPRPRRCEDSRVTVERLRVPGVQEIFESLDQPAPTAFWNLGNIERPDFAAFEEVMIPATPDWVFQHPPDRPAGKRNWGRNHWGLTLYDTVRAALQRAGVDDEADLTDRGDGSVAVTLANPRRRKAFLASCRRLHLRLRRGAGGCLLASRRRRAAPATVEVPGLQTTDPTKTVEEQLQGAGTVQPGANGATAIQTPNPAQALQKAGQLLQQGQLTVNPQHPSLDRNKPPTTTVTTALRRALRAWTGKRWCRGVTADRRGVHVRVACGCGVAPDDLPESIGGIPVHVLVLRLGDDNSSDRNRSKLSVEEAPGRESQDSPDTEVLAAKVEGPSRRKTIKLDPVYQQRYDEAVAGLETMRRTGADPETITKQERLVKYRKKLLDQEKNFVKDFRRPEEWTSASGLDRTVRTFRTEHGGIEDYEDWYIRHRPIVERDFGADRSWGGGPDVFHAVLGITSASTAIGANTTKALQNYRVIKRHVLLGEPLVWVGVTPSVRGQLDALARGQLPTSPKIGPFTRSLIDPANAPTDDVVVDIWMLRLYFGKSTGSDSQKEYIRRDIRKKARETGQPARYVQAVLWTVVRQKYEREQALKGRKKSRSTESDYREALTHPRRRQTIEEIQGIVPPKNAPPQGRRFPELRG